MNRINNWVDYHKMYEKESKNDIPFEDTYVYKLQDVIDMAINMIEKCRVKPTEFFKGLRGSLMMPKEEVDKLLECLRRVR